MARWISGLLVVGLGMGLVIGSIGCGSDKPADKGGKMSSDKMGGDKMSEKMGDKMGADKMSKEK
jgi:hypothetical protein